MGSNTNPNLGQPQVHQDIPIGGHLQPQLNNLAQANDMMRDQIQNVSSIRFTGIIINFSNLNSNFITQ